MDEGLRNTEEHWRFGRNGYRDVPEVTFRDLGHTSHIFAAAEMYWAFCNQVNQEDVSGFKTYEVNGSMVQVTEAEARLWAYISTGHTVRLIEVGGVPAGLLICARVFDNLVAIKCLYVEPWSSGLKLGKRAINSLQPTPKNLMFQSRKANPPERMLGITGVDRIKVSEDEHFFTWMMPWRGDNAT